MSSGASIAIAARDHSRSISSGPRAETRAGTLAGRRACGARVGWRGERARGIREVTANESAGLFWLVVLIALYFLPTIVARLRGAENPNPTFIVNLFLGWTFIGWVVALAMGAGAKVREPKPKTTSEMRQPRREIDALADAIVSGAKTSIGTARVAATTRINTDPFAYAATDLIATAGSSVEMYDRRGAFTLVRTADRFVGWMPTSAIDLTQVTPPPSPTSIATTKVCPQCAETVQAAARICRFCRHEFIAAADPTERLPAPPKS